MNLSTYTKEFTQQFFEFKDWELAFKVWHYEYDFHKESIQFVVSFNPYNSGYWIEKAGTELGNNARIYSHKQIIKLKSRIKKEIERSKSLGVSPKFIS